MINFLLSLIALILIACLVVLVKIHRAITSPRTINIDEVNLKNVNAKVNLV